VRLVAERPSGPFAELVRTKCDTSPQLRWDIGWHPGNGDEFECFTAGAGNAGELVIKQGRPRIIVARN
jgi:hypothetical protein